MKRAKAHIMMQTKDGGKSDEKLRAESFLPCPVSEYKRLDERRDG
jgi:hypothetical protein